MSFASDNTVSSLKMSLMARKLRDEGGDTSLLMSDPIAIVGIGCRFPGHANDPESFWTNLTNGVDSISDVPGDRWNADRFYSQDPTTPGKTNNRSGGFVSEIDQFDPAAFGIAPTEAAYIDPQQRQLLEVAWEAFDDAGYPLNSLRGSRTGVFLALYGNDYARFQFNHLDRISAHTITGTSASVASGRLSYLFDLRGPSIVIDTACSSSLVAIHLAMQSIRDGSSDLAMAGGASLMLSPEITVSLAKWGMLAPDGRCKTFDSSADGFVRGEGSGMIVLKRLSDALRDADRIYAVLRGSAVNQDGRSNVLTAPNGVAQRAVVREALAQARVSPRDVTYVECHGTGTKVGDPIEVEALDDVLDPGEKGRVPCLLGSVKANIGHLEAAAGVAGVIKAALCARKKQIPPQLHFRELNPLIAATDCKFKIPVQTTPWNPDGKPRLAGVSSFGFAGTNAHIVLEQSPDLTQASGMTQPASTLPYLLPFSARQPSGVHDLANAYIDYAGNLASNSELQDLCYTAGIRRSHFEYRAVAVGRNRERIISSLRDIDGAQPVTKCVRKPKVGFVFSGQGCQWIGMARTLLRDVDVFSRALRQCDECLAEFADWSIIEQLELLAEHSRLNETAVFQPVLFAIQTGLVAMWKSWGIEPYAVTGHSVGEIAAAHAAGILRLRDAVRLVEFRGRLMQRASGSGLMAAVGLSFESLQERLSGMSGLDAAASNGPTSSTVSGEQTAIEKLISELERESIYCQQLNVDCAFHSRQMDAFVQPIVDEMREAQFQKAEIPFFSTVHGSLAATRELPITAEYWGENLRQAVQFRDAVTSMNDAGCTAYIEIGPHPVLSAYVMDCIGGDATVRTVFASMRRDQDCVDTVIDALSDLYVHGCDPDWQQLQSPGDVVSLPRYPWQKERFWLDWPASRSASALRPGEGNHPLLGPRLDSAENEQSIFETIVTANDPDYLSHHRLGGVCLFPAAAMIEMMRAAGTDVGGTTGSIAGASGRGELTSFSIGNALVLPDGQSVKLQLIATPDGQKIKINLYAMPCEGKQNWIFIASGHWTMLPLDTKAEKSPGVRIDAVLASEVTPVDAKIFYAEGQKAGLDFGSRFQVLTDIQTAAGCARAKVNGEALQQSDSADYLFHPAILDGCLQVADAAFRTTIDRPELLIPVEFDSCRIFESGAGIAEVLAEIVENSSNEAAGFVEANIVALGHDGSVVVQFSKALFRRAGASVLDQFRSTANAVNEGSDENWCYKIDWAQKEHGHDAGHAGENEISIVCGDDVELFRALAGTESSPLAGNNIFFLETAGNPQCDSGSVFQIDPFEPGSFEAALQSIAGQVDRTNGVNINVFFAWQLSIASRTSLPQHSITPDWNDDKSAIAAALHLSQAVLGVFATSNVKLTFITKGGMAIDQSVGCNPVQTSLAGLVATLQVEHPELRSNILDLDPVTDQVADTRSIENELSNTESLPDRVAYRSGRRYVASLVRYRPGRSHPEGFGDREFQLSPPDSGVLDDLETQALVRVDPEPGFVEIRTESIGLNFRDVLTILNEEGRDDSSRLGAECAGRIVALGAGVTNFSIGDKVMAFAVGAFASHVQVPVSHVSRIPENIDFVQASTLPVAFLTAKYALEQVAKLRAGQSILIHSAAGGVGFAALQVALRNGAVVFATAGSDVKRRMLSRLGVDHVYDSRSLDFAQEILVRTSRRGVDVVLNSLAGDFVPAGLSTVAGNGIFVELGKRDDWTETRVAESYPDVRYCRFDLSEVGHRDPAVISSMFSGIVQEIEEGGYQVLPTTTFPISQIRNAFKTFAQGRHIGKFAVVTGSLQPPSGYIRKGASYLITGGLGALGLGMAERLARDGADCLILAGRSGPADEVAGRIKKIEASGTQVHVATLDIASEDKLSELFEKIDSDLPELKGIVHCAGELSDAAFVQQDWSRFSSVLRAKMDGAWCLHQLTMTRSLDFFVMFSSVAAVAGWPGQSNYSCANAYMDGLASYRVARGLPALSINWGAWSSGGMAQRVMTRDSDIFAAHGLMPHDSEQAFDLVGDLLGGAACQVIAGRFDWTVFSRRYPSASVPGIFDRLCEQHDDPEKSAQETNGRKPADILRKLSDTPAGQKHRVLGRFVTDQAALILGFKPGHGIDRSAPLNEQGLDSLLAVAMRNSLAAAFARNLPASLLFDFPTINALTAHLAENILDLRAATLAPVDRNRQEDEERTRFMADIIDLSDQEAEEQLQKELLDLEASDNGNS